MSTRKQTYTPEQKATKRARRKTIYEARKAAGVCVYSAGCGNRTDGTAYCEECRRCERMRRDAKNPNASDTPKRSHSQKKEWSSYMKEVIAVVVLSALSMVAVGCKKENATPMKKGDNICIGSRFLIVDDMQAYPWVKLTANRRCVEHADTPDSYVNVDRVDSFEPSCVCRYSAACKKSCEGKILDGYKACLEACTD